MGFDSRRRTGRYAPGQMPPEFASGRPYRSRRLRWWLLVAVIVSIGLGIAQLWMPDGHALMRATLRAYWVVTLLVIGISLPATFAEFMVPMPDAEDETL